MNFPPANQGDFEELIAEYSGKENTACLFASVKDRGNPSHGVIGDTMAILVLLVIIIQQVSKSTDSSFADILGALTEINSMDVT